MVMIRKVVMEYIYQTNRTIHWQIASNAPQSKLKTN
jgi:hypothetical protein